MTTILIGHFVRRFFNILKELKLSCFTKLRLSKLSQESRVIKKRAQHKIVLMGNPIPSILDLLCKIRWHK
jgi:hypothetical protein